jgi:uncharacterized repeat protein (TIGR03803 family)
MNTIKNTHATKIKFFCLATWAMTLAATDLTAQVFTTLHSFTATSGSEGSYGTNSDGANPWYVELVLSGNTLYGTTLNGGGSGTGALFAVNTDGAGFTNLYSFEATNNSGINTYGAYPYGGLILSGNTLYGTADSGGFYGLGAVFAVNTDGTGIRNLHSFIGYDDEDGSNPYDPLILSGNTLYGTTVFGGLSGEGTVFAVNADGTDFTSLFYVDGDSDENAAYPYAGLILSGNTLYGTQGGAGTTSGGVFAMDTNGTGFRNVYNFTPASAPSYTNSDGAYPYGGLVLSGNTLYGTAIQGGSGGTGTVFAVNTNGTGLTILHSFTATVGTEGGYGTNGDGAYPAAGLILSGNTLYGTANSGGPSGTGTVFAVNTNGTDYTTLHSFTESFGSGGNPGFGTNSDGIHPIGGLVLSGNILYGTAAGGGSSGNGTVFSLSFPPPQLTITASDTNAILKWPTDDAGFSYSGYTLQSTTNLVSAAVWTPVVPAPVVVNGQVTVTNPISGTQQFYRLSQ